MGNTTSYSKQIVVFFLALSLFIRPTFASSVGGWSMGNPIAQGASTIYEGSKNVIINGADYVKKGTAKITPTAANVAKTLGKGVAGVAVSVAVEQLLGAVDWVLDPANNQIKYTDPNAPSDPNSPALQYYYIYNMYGANKKVSTVNEACILAFKAGGWAGPNIPPLPKGHGCKLTGNNISAYAPGGSFGDIGYRVANPAYDPTAEDDREKTLPLETVAQKVISNAQGGNAAAQVATTAAAADIVAEAETDNVKARPIAQQLESSASTKPADQAVADKAAEAQGTAKPNEANPQATDLALEFPAFCGWAPTVCEFAQTAIQSIADAKAEYADKPEENTDTELDIPDLSDESIDTDISFGGSCPSPLSTPYSFAGVSGSMEFSFQPLCDIASFIKPVVISVSAFAAALIVAGIRTEDD